MPPGNPFLSLLLVNYNGRHHLEECLSSVLAQEEKDFEIVLVDNASADGSLEFLAERFPSVRTVPSAVNLGFAGGNNLGLRHCRGEWIFLLNNDTRMEAGALAALREGIRRHPGNRIFACLMLSHAHPDRVDSAGDNLYVEGAVANYAGYPASLFRDEREVTAACGGAAVYSRLLLEELGGFDEDFFLLLEDVDLALRARHLGERVLFLPGVRVYHKGSASIGGSLSPIGLFYGTRNYAWLFLKTFPDATLFRSLPWIAFMLAMQGVHALRVGRFGVYLKGLREGARRLPAMVGKRRRILSGSRISRGGFEGALLTGWIRERLAYRRGERTVRGAVQTGYGTGENTLKGLGRHG